MEREREREEYRKRKAEETRVRAEEEEERRQRKRDEAVKKRKGEAFKVGSRVTVHSLISMSMSAMVKPGCYM